MECKDLKGLKYNLKNYLKPPKSIHFARGKNIRNVADREEQERVALQERKESSFYKKWQASDNE